MSTEEAVPTPLFPSDPYSLYGSILIPNKKTADASAVLAVNIKLITLSGTEKFRRIPEAPE